MADYSSLQFNIDVLNDLTMETQEEMNMAASQYYLIQDRLRTLRRRLIRAGATGNMTMVASLEIQHDLAAGVLCMYGKYMMRKINKLRNIERYRALECHDL